MRDPVDARTQGHRLELPVRKMVIPQSRVIIQAHKSGSMDQPDQEYCRHRSGDGRIDLRPTRVGQPVAEGDAGTQ